jgi:hypothetical protein
LAYPLLPQQPKLCLGRDIEQPTAGAATRASVVINGATAQAMLSAGRNAKFLGTSSPADLTQVLIEHGVPDSVADWLAYVGVLATITYLSLIIADFCLSIARIGITAVGLAAGAYSEATLSARIGCQRPVGTLASFLDEGPDIKPQLGPC